ncbi:MAG: hypothetical protein DBX36_03120 [Oscillospiraceae bacterium]|nr:MAG: hypothetical protein DBX36_03120 [Oscillospiraceae bacterium]
MSEKYKFSKFNTYVENECGEMIIFNSLSITNAFCKLNPDNTIIFKEALNKKQANLISENILGHLLNRSMIVNDSIDEMKNLEYMKMQVITRTLSGNILGLIILPTGKCNFRCEYCYENFKNGKMSKENQDAIIKFVRKKIYYHSGVSISWFGGEPLLEIDIITYISKKIMDICNSLKKTYSANITTNGYLLSVENMKKLLSCNIYQYQITIDGLQNIHDKYRHLIDGSPTFRQIETNLLNIKNNIKTCIFHISLRCNFTQESLTVLNDFSKWFYKCFENDNRFSIFVRTVGIYGKNNKLSNVLINDGIGNICSKLFEKNQKINNSNIIANFQFLSPGGCVCYAGMDNHFVFDSLGNVRKCTVALSEDYNIVGKIENGEVIIDPSAMAKWVTPQPMHNKCYECSFAGVCMDNVCHTNKVQGKVNTHPNCPHEKSAIKNLILIYDKANKIEYIDK